MKHWEVFKYSIKNLRHRNLRSWLTILGIIIGIGAIVILISLAQGIDKEIRSQLDLFGSNYIQVIPGSMEGMTSGSFSFKGALYARDVDSLKSVAGVKGVSPILLLMLANVRHKEGTVKMTVSGVDPTVMNDFLYMGLEDGRYMKEGDVEGIFIGHKIAHDMFKDDVRVGDVLMVNEESFRVRGIMNEAGDFTGDFDNGIYIDSRAARNLLGDGYDPTRVFAIMIVTEEGKEVSAIAKEVDRVLMKSHKVGEDEKDYSVITPEATAEQVGMVTGLLSLFLGGIAAISLIVGGVGVANSMITSVLERTREIGTLKALGASNQAILEVFMIEAAVLGFIGGIMGIGFALTVSWILGNFGVPSVVTPELLGFALLFSMVVGVISGFFPAKNASRMEAVDALRYE
ncbi:ABC transporter permease [Candidatus Micrarchaeota archaeon]|nr:ABC transporter permease [Candidatus Micrarchaeota archaeon]